METGRQESKKGGDSRDLAAEQNREARVYWRLDTREAIMEVMW